MTRHHVEIKEKNMDSDFIAYLSAYLGFVVLCGGICVAIQGLEDSDSQAKVMSFTIGALLGPLGIVLIMALKLAKK